MLNGACCMPCCRRLRTDVLFHIRSSAVWEAMYNAFGRPYGPIDQEALKLARERLMGYAAAAEEQKPPLTSD